MSERVETGIKINNCTRKAEVILIVAKQFEIFLQFSFATSYVQNPHLHIILLLSIMLTI